MLSNQGQKGLFSFDWYLASFLLVINRLNAQGNRKDLESKSYGTLILSRILIPFIIWTSVVKVSFSGGKERFRSICQDYVPSWDSVRCM